MKGGSQSYCTRPVFWGYFTSFSLRQFPLSGNKQTNNFAPKIHNSGAAEFAVLDGPRMAHKGFNSMGYLFLICSIFQVFNKPENIWPKNSPKGV